MTHWLFPANTKFYDVLGAFNEAETYWPVNTKVSIGDVVYIYLAAPYKQIAFVCDVVDIDLELDNIIEKIIPFFKGKIDNKKPSKLFMKLTTTSKISLEDQTILNYSNLKENGLNGMLMGARKLENNPPLLDYIQRNLL